MVSVVHDGRIDIHNYKQRLKRATRFLENHPEISLENKNKILGFLDRIRAEGLSPARQVSYVQWLTTTAVTLGKNLDEATKHDIEHLMKTINSKDWSNSTKENYRETIKKFWRWLKGLEKGKDPPETDWFRVGKGKGKDILPEELLTREEAKRLIEVAEHPRDKAYVAVSDESGARPGEILSMRIRSVAFDQYGAVIVVNGKVGERRIRLISSAPNLATWLDNHPHRDDSDAPLWVNVGTTRHGGIFDYDAARKLLRELGKKAGVKKRMHPYIFRHSTATYLANYLTEAQMCKYFGWKQGSRMPSYYVHLSGRDIDSRMLELHGLKKKEEEPLKLTARICPRCETKNSATGKYCNRCGSTLDIKEALELDQRIARAEEVMEALLKDNKVKAFLAEKMRELRLAEDLA
jgi:integrase/ribosomal protein L40E